MDERFALENFDLYNRARAFRKKTYALVKQLPNEEKFALDVQMRKAAVSVTNNIAEGHARWHYQENIRFLYIARGSLGELLDDFNICLDEEYGDQQLVNELKELANEVMRRINGYVRYLETSKQGQKSKTANRQK